MRTASPPSLASPLIPLERTDEIKSVVRAVLNQQHGRSELPCCGIAVISANRGAGTSSVSNAMIRCVNKLAMEREASRMAAHIAETVSSSPVHGERLRMMTAIKEIVTETAVCTDPSRLAISLDYRRLNRPGAEFGAVVAGTLTAEVLQSQTNAGRSVRDVLDGLPIEWDSMPHCRKDCLSFIAELFRLVVVDLPSREESSGFQDLTSLVDGVIIVVEEGRTTTRDVAMLTHEIEAGGGNVMGYVLNKHKSPIPTSLMKHFAKVGLT